jgi:hypothetical protein
LARFLGLLLARNRFVFGEALVDWVLVPRAPVFWALISFVILFAGLDFADVLAPTLVPVICATSFHVLAVSGAVGLLVVLKFFARHLCACVPALVDILVESAAAVLLTRVFVVDDFAQRLAALGDATLGKLRVFAVGRT